MKRLLLIALACVALTGCTTRTEYGECVGLADDKDPTLHYKVSAWNVFLGVVFIEAILPPIVVAVDDTFCPVGKK
jgi:hypothetical protein